MGNGHRVNFFGAMISRLARKHHFILRYVHVWRSCNIREHETFLVF